MRRIIIALFAIALSALSVVAQTKFDPDKPFGFPSPHRYRVTFHPTDPLDGQLTVHVYTDSWVLAGKKYTMIGNPGSSLLSPRSGNSSIVIFNHDCVLQVGAYLQIVIRQSDGYKLRVERSEGILSIGVVPLTVYDYVLERDIITMSDSSYCD